MNKRIFKTARKLHKWLGYFLVIQIFAWLLGGLFMSAMPLEKVHGKHLANRQLEIINTVLHVTRYNLLVYMNLLFVTLCMSSINLRTKLSYIKSVT